MLFREAVINSEECLSTTNKCPTLQRHKIARNMSLGKDITRLKKMRGQKDKMGVKELALHTDGSIPTLPGTPSINKSDH